MESTTSWEVGPAGLSMRIAPSSGPNSCMASTGRVEGLFDRRDHAALNGQGSARDAGAGRGAVAAAAKLAGDVAHVHAVAFRAEADARQFRIQLFKDAGHDDRFDGADVVNEPLGVGGVRAGAREVGLLEPEVSDLIVVREPEMVIEVLEQADAGEGVGLVNLVADGG